MESEYYQQKLKNENSKNTFFCYFSIAVVVLFYLYFSKWFDFGKWSLRLCITNFLWFSKLFCIRIWLRFWKISLKRWCDMHVSKIVAIFYRFIVPLFIKKKTIFFLDRTVIRIRGNWSSFLFFFIYFLGTDRNWEGWYLIFM